MLIEVPAMQDAAEGGRKLQPPFRLIRHFSVASLLGILVVLAVLLQFYRYFAFTALTDHETRGNIALARVFANTIWPSHAAFVRGASAIPRAEMAQRPELVSLREDVLRQMTGLNVVKVKLYNLDGLTVFSTDQKQIGEDKSKNSGFQSAKAGGTATEITFRDKFDAFEQVINDRNLVSTYLPIRVTGDPEVAGVMEVYSDVTDLVATLEKTQWQIVGGVLGSLSLLYLFLFTIVRRADKLIRAQNQEVRLTHEAMLLHQENYDSLTGLANRRLFLERVAQHIRGALSGGHKLALFLIDLERFRNINESLGRPAGDALLKQVAEWLARDAGDANLVARVGTDHFAEVLPEVRLEHGSRSLEKSIAAFLEHPFRLNDAVFRIAAKIGIATFPNDGTDADTLFRNAEAALKKAKAGGDRFLFYTKAMNERVAEKMSLENKLRQALEKDEFVLHYQPKVDTDTRRIVGVEALIRWQSPELGLVPPMKFISLLEETGLILPVGSWAIMRASLDHRSWVNQGLKAPRVAVNVSPLQLRQRDFVSIVEQAIMEGVAPTGIDLEITESLIMEDIQGNIEKLKAVRGLGVRIAIDDFGTGYSSLSYLAKLPVQTLKIDRSFIITMLKDQGAMTLVQTMISLAHSLKLKVVAEGVDEEEQAKILKLLRCDEMQGYLFSKPLPFAQITEMLVSRAEIRSAA